MSKDSPINECHVSENFYTFQELKDFTNNFTDRSITNVTEFIEIKTIKKYTVIEKQLLCDLNNIIFDYEIAAFDIAKFLNELWDINKDNNDVQTINLIKAISRFLNGSWTELRKKNWLVKHKWKEQLKTFET